MAGAAARAGVAARPADVVCDRRKICRFCLDKVDLIDFKDVKLLQNYIPERGKVLPRRISGSCAHAPAYAGRSHQARAQHRAASIRSLRLKGE